MNQRKTSMVLATLAMLIVVGGGGLMTASNIDAVGETFAIDGLLYTVTAENEVSVGAESTEISGHVTIPASVENDGTTYSVTALTALGFMDCASITGFTIPTSVTTIYQNAFIRCTGVTEIEIPDSVTFIGNDVFSGCTNLTSCKLSSSLTRLSTSLFYKCESLESITVPAGVTYISRQAFVMCYGLSDIWFLSETAPEFYGDRELDTRSQAINGFATTVHTFGWGTDETFASSYDGTYTTILVETISQMDFISVPESDGIYAYV